MEWQDIDGRLECRWVQSNRDHHRPLVILEIRKPIGIEASPSTLEPLRSFVALETYVARLRSADLG
jgi:hypothetical protein